MNSIVFILARLLEPGTDWKKVLKEEGAAVVQQRITTLWQARLAKHTAGVAQKMQGEGWSWAAAQDPAFLKVQRVDITTGDEVLGPGFLISRDALYAILDKTGVPGGAVKDGLRDAYDNAVWAGIKDQVNESTPLAQIVELTAAELVRVIF